MSRTHISLDGTWDFFIDPEQSLESLDHASIRREIVVPGPWQAQFDDLRNYSGVAWYRRSFELATDHRQEEPRTENQEPSQNKRTKNTEHRGRNREPRTGNCGAPAHPC